MFDRPYQCKFSFYVPISYRGEFPDSCPLRHDGIAVAIKTLSFTAPPCPSCLYTWHQQSPSNPTFIFFSFLFIFVGGHNIDSVYVDTSKCDRWQCHLVLQTLPDLTFVLYEQELIMKLVHKFPFQKLLQSERKLYFSSPLCGAPSSPGSPVCLHSFWLALLISKIMALYLYPA